MKKYHKLFLIVVILGVTVTACSDDDEDTPEDMTTPTTVIPTGSVDTTSISRYTSINVDAAADEDSIFTSQTAKAKGLDGTEILYLYNQDSDVLKFRIKMSNMSVAQTSPSVDLSFELPNGTTANDATTTPFRGSTQTHRTATAYANVAGGAAPSSYSYTTNDANGVSLTTQLYDNPSNYQGVCANCVGVNVDLANNWMTITIDRNEIITDAEVGSSKTASINLVANVGRLSQNSDLVADGETFTITIK